MNKIVGSVLHRETNLGISRLLVTVFDAKPNANTKSAPTLALAEELQWTRL